MTKTVRFLRDWTRYAAGTILNIQASLADSLIQKGIVEEFKFLNEPSKDKMIRSSTATIK
jgi:hypothetical protein